MAPPLVLSMPNEHSQFQRQELKNRKVVLGLAITEVITGGICMVMGGTIYLTYVSADSRSFGPATGEGIYLGAMSVIAGGLGIGTARDRKNRCLLLAYMIFSFIASFFSAALFSACIIFWTLFPASPDVRGMYIVITMVSFVSFVVLLISGSFCCRAAPGCCEPQILPSNQTQVVLLQETPQGENSHPASKTPEVDIQVDHEAVSEAVGTKPKETGQTATSAQHISSGNKRAESIAQDVGLEYETSKQRTR